jgi:hypothetical protein
MGDDATRVINTSGTKHGNQMSPFRKVEMWYQTYNSTKLVNFVKSEGKFPVKFFLDNELPSTRDRK